MPSDAQVTLERMDAAVRYNAWLGAKFRPHLGHRVLEIGAGLGTITKQIAQGRELVIALEVEDSYFARLQQTFEGSPNVRPYRSDVSLDDWMSLRAEGVDSILLSNVLEHIPDDGAAVRRFRQVLPQGGKLVLLVPAIEQLFGSLDRAVGHHRRYTPATLRQVVEENGFSLRRLEWMNLAGIPGWFVNARLLKRRAMPPLQLRLYDLFAPLIARAESKVKLPIGMSLFAVAEAR
jgi:SAM-dependent methyltransferase